jgi:hypothetical protein
MQNNKQSEDAEHFSLPIIVTSIIDWSAPCELSEFIKGDISEGLFLRLAEGKPRAYFWLFKQVVAILWHFSPSTQKGSIMFIFSFTIISAVVLMTFWMAGPVSMFFNVPSLIIVVIPAVLAPFLAFIKNDIYCAFKALIDSNMPAENVAKYQRVFEIIGKVAMLMGWFGVISGAIAIASNVKVDTFAQVFGPAFAVMSLTLLYALIIKVFCFFAILRIGSFKLEASATS